MPELELTLASILGVTLVAAGLAGHTRVRYSRSPNARLLASLGRQSTCLLLVGGCVAAACLAAGLAQTRRTPASIGVPIRGTLSTPHDSSSPHTPRPAPQIATPRGP